MSHSFNQFVQADKNYLYRADHGDANPRVVSITRCSLGGKITDVDYTLPLEIGGGYRANDTGVSVGGFELSSDSCLIAGNSAPTACFLNCYDLETYRKSGIERISIHGLSGKIAAGKKVKLSATVLSKDAPKRTVKWKSSNTKVATVDKSGMVKMKKGSGGKSVKITASATDGSGVKKSVTIKIK